MMLCPDSRSLKKRLSVSSEEDNTGHDAVLSLKKFKKVKRLYVL